jgi:hypothetical protein
MNQSIEFKRNEAVGLDLGWINQIKVNRNAAERRAASLANRRTVKQQYQAAWLVQAIKCIDLTTLGGDDTPGRVERLCMKAMRPLRSDLMEALGLATLSTGAVCVYHEMITPAVRSCRAACRSPRSRPRSRPDWPAWKPRCARSNCRRRRRHRNRHRDHPPARPER